MGLLSFNLFEAPRGIIMHSHSTFLICYSHVMIRETSVYFVLYKERVIGGGAHDGRARLGYGSDTLIDNEL